MSVRAKFFVSSKKQSKWGRDGEVLTTVTLHPVSAGSSKENESFYRYTPAGSVELGTLGDVEKNFELGKEYYLDFTEAENV